MARKPRTDSVEAERKVQQAAQDPIKPPIPLTAAQNEVFGEIIEGLPHDRWDRHAIRKAAHLAKMECELEELIERCIEEGPTYVNANGNVMQNPAYGTMMTLGNNVKQVRGILGLNASQRGISEKTTKAAKEAERKSRAALKSVKGSNKSDLLA
jgi:hypothetical protein